MQYNHVKNGFIVSICDTNTPPFGKYAVMRKTA
jgi:hypothetical protein